MDFMKVFDQTVREIKREVNLKVFQIPEIEQKVLDATDNEPWGPHGTALAEIAQATKKYSECQIVMNVLWTRLSETGKDWRYVYKALTVIEYLIANGSERAVDEIIEHTYRIASLSSFEYVEPSGKDMGINVRKKVENILAVLNDKEKIQEARAKAAKTRDKYFGLSSSGITYKSSSGIASSSYRSNNYGGDKYESFSGTVRNDSFGGKKNEKEHTREGRYVRDSSTSHRVVTVENQVKSSKRESTRYGSKDRSNASSSLPESSMDKKIFEKHSSSLSSSKYDDDFDDFDPRGTSTAKSNAGRSNEVDLFANFVNEPAATLAPEASDVVTNDAGDGTPDTDLFQDAAFLSASSTESIPQNEMKMKVNLFASQPAIAPISSTVNLLFDDHDHVTPLESTESASVAKLEPKELTTPPANLIDPFASVPLNNFEDSDIFGTFTSQVGSTPTDTSNDHTKDINQNNMSGGNIVVESAAIDNNNKNYFKVKSGIWADSLSRGLIDLNISAPKKVNLADVGVVGDLSDGSNGRDKGAAPPHSFYMGNAMGSGSGSGSGLNQSTFGSSSSLNVDDFFSSLSNSSSSREENQFGSFKK